MAASFPALKFVLLANPENRRVTLFQEALVGLGFAPAAVVSYIDFLSGRARLEEVLTPRSILRLESPGENFEVEKALLALGADASSLHSPRLSREQALNLSFEKGRIQFARQWYAGLTRCLRMVQEQAAPAPKLWNAPEDVALMFHKQRCHRWLKEADISVPPALASEPSCFEELLAQMNATGWGRVFLKPNHGSSASGVVAFARAGDRMLAWSSAELVREANQVKLFNSLKVRRYEKATEIRQLIDSLCPEGVHVERWLPKASQQGGAFDLRFVVIDGRPRHTVMRVSKSPMTNLHLGNRRGDVAVCREACGTRTWSRLEQACVALGQVFRGTHSFGADIMLQPGLKEPAVLEVNAFGDLLPNVLWNGLSTYQAALAALAGGETLERAVA